MGLEYGKIGPLGIQAERWHPAKGLVFELDGDELSNLLLRGKKNILEFVRVEGECVVVGRLLRQENGDYEPSVITFTSDQIGNLNSVIKSPLVSPKFRLASSSTEQESHR